LVSLLTHPHNFKKLVIGKIDSEVFAKSTTSRILLARLPAACLPACLLSMVYIS
jgi:hypothetical protein